MILQWTLAGGRVLEETVSILQIMVGDWQRSIKEGKSIEINVGGGVVVIRLLSSHVKQSAAECK